MVIVATEGLGWCSREAAGQREDWLRVGVRRTLFASRARARVIAAIRPAQIVVRMVDGSAKTENRATWRTQAGRSTIQPNPNPNPNPNTDPEADPDLDPKSYTS